MASNLKSVGAFALTPHKVSVSILVQLYASPSSGPVPFPFSNIPQHNRLAIFLTSLTKSCDNFLEPQLDELVIQLKAASYELNEFLTEQLNNRLSSLISPDDLFNFFNSLRVVVGNAEGGQVEDDQILLDPNSNLGMFVRRCVLAFNLLSFEGVCHLLTDIGTYCREFFSSCPTDPRLDLSIPKMMLGFDEEFKNESELSEDDKLELESDPFEREAHGFRGGTSSGKNSIFHTYAARSFFGQGGQHEASYIQDSVSSKFNHHMDGTEDGGFVFPFSDPSRINNLHGERFLRTNWQVQGYLAEQADLIERQTSLISMSVFESMLKQLQTLAPELHRVHYLRYLISLYHDDYTPALDNLHCYFDYSAGIEGIDTGSSSMLSDLFIGRYETALLCLGIMHSHFGHSKQAIEALTEAVRISQQNNDDSCLAYTLAAICDLLSSTGVPSTIGIIGSAYSPGTNTGLGGSLSTQQQLLVLLKRSLKRADSLKLTRLVAFNRLALAKFDLKHVKRPLVSFGPKAPTVLRTCPISVCKELRLTSYLLSEFCSDVGSQPIDGAFSTSWLKNLLKPGAPSILVDADVSGSLDAFYFGGQPSPIPGHVLQLAGESYLVKASAWELYGSAPLVRLNALVHATCFADGASSGDLSSAYAKLIQHLAVFKGYKEAFTALKLVEGKFSSVSKSRIKFLRLQLLHDYALHRGHIKLAQQICDEFGVLASSVAGVDMELKTEARLRHARTFLAANQFSQAAVVAHSLFCMCYKYSMQVENATVLLLLAEIHKKSGNAVSGLPYALASLSFCQSFNLDLLEASATLTLTELWLSLGSNHAKRALTLLQRALPMILGHGGLELRARANIAVAKCYLSDPCFSVSDDLNTVLDPLKQASEELQILEYHELAAEAFYLMAITYNKLGQLEEREDAATSFKKHVNALENPQNQDEPFLYGT